MTFDKYKISLIIVILIAAFIRLYNITDRGFFIYDEAYYMREAKFFYSVSRNLGLFVRLVKNRDMSIEKIKEQIQGIPPAFTPKPLHALMLGTFSIIFGLHDYTGGLYSSFFGLLNILLLYYLLKNLTDKFTALCGTIVLSFSMLHIYYSRNAFAEVDSLFFVLLCLYLFIKENNSSCINKKTNFLAGIIFSLSVATNYRNLWVIGILIPFYFVYNLRFAIKRSLFFISGSVLTLLLFEFPYFVVRLFKSFPPKFYSFLEMLLKWYLKKNPAGYAAAQGKSMFTPHLMLFHYFTGSEGLFYVTVFFISILVILLFKRKKDFLLVTILSILPLLLFSLTVRGNKPHAFSTSFPFIPAVIVIALYIISNKFFTNKKYFTIIITAIIVILAVPKIKKELPLTSGYRELADYLLKHNGKYHYTTNDVMTRFYINRDSGYLVPKTLKEYKSYKYGEQANYFVTDFFYYTDFNPDKKITDFLIENGELVKVIDNNFVTISIGRFIYEAFFFNNIEQFKSIKDLDKIKIYKIEPGILDRCRF